MFGMLMDDDNSDNGINFGRARAGRRVVGARSMRMYRGYGDVPDAAQGALDYNANLQPDPTDPVAVYVPPTSNVDASTTSNTGTSASPPWWTGVLTQGLQATGAIVGGVVKAATGTTCTDPNAPFYSPVTRMCYPTAAAAQAASGGGGMLLVGALGVGILVWLASGKGGPAAG